MDVQELNASDFPPDTLVWAGRGRLKFKARIVEHPRKPGLPYIRKTKWGAVVCVVRGLSGVKVAVQEIERV